LGFAKAEKLAPQPDDFKRIFQANFLDSILPSFPPLSLLLEKYLLNEVKLSHEFCLI
jgi:hypothetical protein